MNYRHAFHAGNFADVMKHAVLTRILVHLCKKPTAFRVIDTHAGLGLYDLAGDEAERTGEWRDGVGRLEEPFGPEVEGLLAPYRAVIAATRQMHGNAVYPGSPAIVAEFLRAQDRAVFNELHPEDAETLALRFKRDKGVKVTTLDGWTALKAFIPPMERRGLVLIDPPYEERGELDRLATELGKAVQKWPTGIFVAWYPIKDRAPVDAALRRLDVELGRPGLVLELSVAPADTRLGGSGLLVVNPPWTLRAEAETLLPALAERLGGGRGGWRCQGLGRET